LPPQIIDFYIEGTEDPATFTLGINSLPQRTTRLLAPDEGQSDLVGVKESISIFTQDELLVEKGANHFRNIHAKRNDLPEKLQQEWENDIGMKIQV
jgi:hypothetical protein